MLKARTLITGARGYLGGRLVRHLASQGRYVVGATRGLPNKPGLWPKDIPLIQLDPTSNVNVISEALSAIDCVIHLAAANEWRSAADPDAALFETGSGTRRMLEASIAAGVQRFVFLSTIHVYGAPLLGELSETVLPRPMHPYAISHMVGEAFTLAAHSSGKIQGIVVRLSNGIGAPAWTDVDRWTLVGNDFARQVVETGEIVAQSPEQWRDFITLSDVCKGLEILCDAPKEKSAPGVFNLANGSAIRVQAVAERMGTVAERLLGRPVLVRYPIRAFSDNIAPFHISIDRMKSLGFVPSLQDVLDQEFSDTINLLMHHRVINVNTSATEISSTI